MAQQPRRRYIFRDMDIEHGWVSKVGTNTARVFPVLVESASNVDHMGMITLLATAHHQDLMAVSGQPAMVTYPEDVADLVGYSQTRASTQMNDLKRQGFLAGSHQAGYRLAGPMVPPRAFDTDR